MPWESLRAWRPGRGTPGAPRSGPGPGEERLEAAPGALGLDVGRSQAARPHARRAGRGAEETTLPPPTSWRQGAAVGPGGSSGPTRRSQDARRLAVAVRPSGRRAP